MLVENKPCIRIFILYAAYVVIKFNDVLFKLKCVTLLFTADILLIMYKIINYSYFYTIIYKLKVMKPLDLSEFLKICLKLLPASTN